MPCNSDYLEASWEERELSKVVQLLDELDGKPLDLKEYGRGYDARVYNRTSKLDADRLVAKLCERLSAIDVTKHSLEMQIWWRDHQQADAARVERERREELERRARKDAEGFLAMRRKELGLK